MWAKERLLVALDAPEMAEALRLARDLREEVGGFRVGWELYWTSSGAGALAELIQESHPAKIMLDLQLYDLPAVVVDAIRTLPKGVAWVTVDENVGTTALRQIARRTPVPVLATVGLNGLSSPDLKALGFSPRFVLDPEALAVRRAKQARAAGCAGVVCSSSTAEGVRKACGPDFPIFGTGIHLGGVAMTGDDHEGMITPYRAIRSGADYIVVDSAMLAAPEPVAAARRLVAEIAAALLDRDF